MATLQILALAIVLPVMAQAQTFRVGGCPPLERYVMPEGVEVTPGVDANGWALAPVDLNASAINASDFESVPIGLDLPIGSFLNTESFNYDFEETEALVGTMVVNQDGGVMFNGRSLGDSEIYVNEDCLPQNTRDKSQ